MATKNKYVLALNLGLLGVVALLSLFETSKGTENLLENSVKEKHYDFSLTDLVESNNSLLLSKLEHKEVKFLTLQIFADKQYDYDQKIYLAEGNVKALINGGILRSDFLSYDKLTGVLSAEGNVSFKKRGQYFRAKEFKFNLIKKEGFINDVYGILDIKNVLEDLKIDSNLEKTLVNNRSINILNNQGKISYKDGIEFGLGSIKLPQNKITRSNKSIGSINDWRFKSNLITIQESGWKSDRINFTNDPFDPNQISFEGIDVIAEEVGDGSLIITSSRTHLILGSRNKFFLGKRIFGNKENKSKFSLSYDGKNRDGLVLFRGGETKKINKNVKVDFNPQFLIGRALLGETNSYNNYHKKGSETINFFDLLGLNINLNAQHKDWIFDSLYDFSTLNGKRIFKGLRHSSSLRKYFKMPIIDEASLNIFTNYRSRAWNGTIGETDIYSAYGAFIEKNHSFQFGEVKNNLNLRLGTAKYEAEKLNNIDNISLLRTNVFASLDSEYAIWNTSQKNININKDMFLSPILINPELVFKTKINSAYFKYEDGKDQGFIELSLGPELRLGKLEKNFFDYTKLSVMPGIKFKAGNSPFKFDNVVDLKTVNISLMQQLYGPLMVDMITNLNIDNSSENYGEYFDTKLGILWHKRTYEFGLYYHPNNDAGGIYFRLNGFDFDDSVKAVF